VVLALEITSKRTLCPLILCYISTPHHVKRQLVQQLAAQGRWHTWENIIMLVILMIKWLIWDSDSFALSNILFIRENVETFKDIYLAELQLQRSFTPPYNENISWLPLNL